MENQPVQPNIPPNPTPQPSKKAPLIILIALILLLLGAGAIYAWQNYSQLFFPKTSSLTKITPTPNPAITPSPVSQIPADWKTYKNEKFGFEFKYPEKNRYEPQRMEGDTSPIFCYLLDEKATPKSIEGTACIWTGIISQDQLNTMGITYCGDNSKDLRCQFLKINEEVGFTIDWGIEVSGTNQKKASAWISHPKGGVVTVELQPVEPKSKELFIQILSTFKFTDQEDKIEPSCDYIITDCSKYVVTLYKAGLPLGSEVEVSGGPILERMSNAGMQKYRVYKVQAKIPLKNGLIWIASQKADSGYMHIQEDKRLIIADLLGYGAANPDFAISNESFQTLVNKLLSDYNGKGPVTIAVSPYDLTINIKAPENYNKTVRIELVWGLGEIKQIP